MANKKDNVIVEYRNKMNLVAFNGMTAREQNIFFAVASRMRNKGTEKVSLSYAYLMQLTNINYKHRIGRFTELLENFSKQMTNLQIYHNDSKKFVRWVLFPTFEIDKAKKLVTIRINPDLAPFLNHLKQWTRFSLREFVHLKSKYSKTALRLCKQYRVVGHLKMSVKRFNWIFNVPKAYKTAQVTRQIIHPIMIELIPLLKGFCVYRLRGAHNKTTGYLFTWSPEQNNKDDFSKGTKRDKEHMLKLIQGNAFATRSEKRAAVKEVNVRHRQTMREKFHTVEREPSNIFHRTLKTTDLSTLKMLYNMQIRHSPVIHLSPSQTRKLKRRINELSKKQK